MKTVIAAWKEFGPGEGKTHVLVEVDTSNVLATLLPFCLGENYEARILMEDLSVERVALRSLTPGAEPLVDYDAIKATDAEVVSDTWAGTIPPGQTVEDLVYWGEHNPAAIPALRQDCVAALQKLRGINVVVQEVIETYQ